MEVECGGCCPGPAEAPRGGGLARAPARQGRGPARRHCRVSTDRVGVALLYLNLQRNSVSSGLRSTVGSAARWAPGKRAKRIEAVSPR
jgi:hypothetical protein